MTYSKRCKGHFKKASELCRLCSAHAAVIVLSMVGKPCSFGDPSTEEVISEYIRGDGDVALAMDLTKWVDVKTLIVKYDSVCDFVHKKLEDLEKNSFVMIGPGVFSGAGLGCNSENLSNQEIDLILEGFKACCSALVEDCLYDGDGDAFLTSLEKSTAAGGSLGVDSTPTHFDLEGCEFNPDNFLNLFGDCVGDSDRDSFLTLPENLAIGGGISREESMLCDLEGCGFDLDKFLSLFKNRGDNSGSDNFLTLPENSTISGRSSGKETMLCDLEECGINPDEFLYLKEDFVSDRDCGNFLTLLENSAIDGGS